MYIKVKNKNYFATTGGKTFDKNKPVIIFIHGSGLDHTFWGLHSRFFAYRNYSVLCLDNPGHSNSEGPPLKTIEEMGDWLEDIILEINAKNISLVTHSQGCLIGLEFASKYKDRLKSISFIASGLETPVNEALIKSAEENSETAIAMMMSWGFGNAGHLHQGPIPGNSMLANGRNIMRRNVPLALSADLKACNKYKNGENAAKNIECPQQVILAGKDRMAPRKAGMKLVENLPNPNLSIINNSGHMLPLEAPNRCRTLLRNFIFQNNQA